MKKIRPEIVLTGILVMMIGCKSTPTAIPVATQTPGRVATETQVPTKTITVTVTPSQTSTDFPISTATPTGAATFPLKPNPVETSALITRTNLIIDHNAVLLFDHIPDEYIEAASKLLWLHRHASVGANIRMGLDCLANIFPERPYAPQIGRRPPWCDQGLTAEDIIYNEKYESSNWIFELHSQPNANPGWYNKVNYFLNRMENLNPGESYDYASFNFGYVEDSSINNHFFTADNPDEKFPSVADLEALERELPETDFIWWTMALARLSEPHHEEFNQQLRTYALSQGKIIFDIADIESHLPDGTACTGVDQNGNPNEIEALCDIYTNEPVGGHLNALGSLRMSKATWVLMAILAGWDGNIDS